LDFACLESRLAIEVDGEAHNRGDRPARDEVRDRKMLEQGFRTLRIPATVILKDIASAVQGILAACSQGPLHHSPSASGPPPRAGEEFQA